ncbi:hypothetical protein IB695_05123 [Escherichia coli]|nr:hypothetical protein [Escherichia coli]SQS33637.1 Uncharacterised protein [Escherichia coli]SQS41196.1 Uncharacterised protein [Escherichia coli]SQS96137.1 Uncharacterised protein [Escherichia coli]SQW21449.1 Uncharacterised protein [Escherichia coli]
MVTRSRKSVRSVRRNRSAHLRGRRRCESGSLCVEQVRRPVSQCRWQNTRHQRQRVPHPLHHPSAVVGLPGCVPSGWQGGGVHAIPDGRGCQRTGTGGPGEGAPSRWRVPHSRPLIFRFRGQRVACPFSGRCHPRRGCPGFFRCRWRCSWLVCLWSRRHTPP